MKITLYEEVALRDDYSVVFDTQEWFWGKNTPFAQYLKSRNSYEEEIENAYFSNDGSISISWPIYRTLPSGITYMKVEHDNETKYFFINSYEYRNEVIVLNYTLDVWHTYSKDMGIYSGVINRARYIPEGYRKTLPSAYTTNEALSFNGRESTFYLVAEFQVYRLTQDIDNSVERYSYTSLVSYRDFAVTTPTETGEVKPKDTIYSGASFRFTIDQAIAAINKLTAYQGMEQVSNYNLGSGWGASGFTLKPQSTIKVSDNMALYSAEFSNEYKPEEIRYELMQVYAVPYQLSPQTIFNTATNAPAQATILTLDTITIPGTTIEGATYNFNEYQFTKITNEMSNVAYTIPKNDTLVGVGLTSLFIPIAYNGIEHSLNLRSQATAFGFNVSIIGEAGISDITQHFAIPIPFTTPSGTERQLAALNRENAKRQAVASTIALGMNVLSILSPLGGPVAEGISNYALSMKELQGYPQEQPIRSSLYAAGYGFSGAGGVSTLGHVGKNILNNQGVGLLYQGTSLINSITQLQSPVSSGNATDSNPIALLNAAYGFSTYTIVPNNQEEIDYMISRIGYNTWIQSNDYRNTNTSSFLSGKYEPIQFATLQVHGSFPNNISSSLEQILLDGTLISYDPQVYNKL